MFDVPVRAHAHGRVVFDVPVRAHARKAVHGGASASSLDALFTCILYTDIDMVYICIYIYRYRYSYRYRCRYADACPQMRALCCRCGTSGPYPARAQAALRPGRYGATQARMAVTRMAVTRMAVTRMAVTRMAVTRGGQCLCSRAHGWRASV